MNDCKYCKDIELHNDIFHCKHCGTTSYQCDTYEDWVSIMSRGADLSCTTGGVVIVRHEDYTYE